MRKPASVLALLLLVFSSGVGALGLGDIELLSALNEPLDARIPLRAVREGELGSIQIRLASKEHFEIAGIERPFVLTSMKYTVVETTPGAGEIRISTRAPLNEPFLNFLLDVDWPQGRVVREYTVLLDPPIYGAAIATTVEQVVTKVEALPELDEPEAVAVVLSDETTGTSTTTTITPTATTPTTTTTTTTTDIALGSYGVKSSDTLWSLAQRYRPSGSVTMQQTMLAMLRANPNAFSQENVNMLQAGAVLRVPDLDEIQRISAAEALSEVKRQHALWEEYRQSSSRAVSQQPTGESADTVQGGDEAAATETGESTSTATAPQQAEDASRLDIVSAGTAEVGAGGSDVSALQNQLSLSKEEVDIERRKNEDLQARLDDRNETISGLKRMVELKEEDIAALQDKLAETEAQLKAAQAQALEASEAQAAAEAAAQAQSTVETETEVTTEPETEVTTTIQPEPKPTSFMDRVAAFIPLNNPLILGGVGGGLLLLIILIVVLMKRRRQPEWVDLDAPAEEMTPEDDTLTEMSLDDDPEISLDDDATRLPLEERLDEFEASEDEDATRLPPEATEITDIPAEEQLDGEPEDPLEGLNIYLAYEDYDNATKLVEGVIAQHPDRHEYKLRLLEIYYAAKNLPAFETAAQALTNAVGDDSPMMDNARRWWDDLSPERGLFEAVTETDLEADSPYVDTYIGGPGEEAIFDVTGEGEEALGRDETMEISLDKAEAEGEGGGIDFDLGFEFEGAEGDRTELPATEQSGTLDFELTAEGDAPGEQAPSGEDDLEVDFDLTMGTEPTEPPAAAEIDGHTADFELVVSDEGESPEAVSDSALDTVLPDEASAAAGSAGDISLDLGEPPPAERTELPAVETPAEDSGLDFTLDADAPTDVPPTEEASTDDGLDFALDVETPSEEPAGELESSSSDDGLDFSLDLDEPADAPSGVAAAVDSDDGLDFALDIEAPSDGDPESSDSDDGLDFSLDSASDDQELDFDTAAEDTDAAADDSVDFALDIDEPESTPDASSNEESLDFSLDLDESDESSDTQATQYMLRDAPDKASTDGPMDSTTGETPTEPGTVFTLDEPSGDASDLDLTLEVDDGAATETNEATRGDSVDFELDIGDDALAASPPDVTDHEETSFILDETPSTQDIDDALDFSLEVDEPDNAGADAGGGQTGGETTILAPADRFADAPALDLELDEPAAEPPASDFDTLQLSPEELARVGALGEAGSESLDGEADEMEIDSDFAAVFGEDSPADSDDLPALDMELPDSALAAEEADVADASGLDRDLEATDEPRDPEAESDYQKTQYMLRDIAAITSDDQVEDDHVDTEPRTVSLGGAGEADEMQTKLDLAQAYIDMGDNEGARNILGEVMAEGNEAQQEVARQLLTKLN